MMLLMFAVGVMNVVWMAALGMVMTIEKLGTHDALFPRARIVFIAVGAAFIVDVGRGALAGGLGVGEQGVAENWKLKGDFVLSCNCTVFCPCVISLGQHEPTEGYCQTWAGIRIEEGHHEEVDISGINVGLLLDIPGRARARQLDRGALRRRARLDLCREGADPHLHRQGRRLDRAVENPGRRLPRRAHREDHLRDQGRHAHLPDPEDHRRRGEADHRQGQAARTSWSAIPATGSARDVTIARAETSRVRAFGRNWNFAGRSAELVRLDWGS